MWLRVPVTQEGYRDYYGDTAAVVTPAILASAGRMVDRMLVSAVYQTDENDHPVNPDVYSRIEEALYATIRALLLQERDTTQGTSNPLGAKLSSARIDGVEWRAEPQGTIPAEYRITRLGFPPAAARAAIQAIPRRVYGPPWQQWEPPTEETPGFPLTLPYALT